MTIVFLLLLTLLGGFIVLRIKHQDRQATPRRHHRQPHINRKKEMLETFNNTIDVNDALAVDEASEEPLEKKQPTVQSPVEYLVLHVMASEKYPYSGYELLQTLLASGFRYGDMNIFHRYETKTGRGPLLFSLASVNKPGTFELPKMGSFSCPGLTLIMPLKDSPDPMVTFDTMLETTRELVEDLGGEVWDEHRQVLSMDKITQMRARIRKFERNQRMPDFFDELQTD